MVPFVFATLLFVFSSGAFAVNVKEAIKFVPGGEVVQEKLKEVKVKTPQGSIVEIEFDSGGKFEEASGENIDKDIFQPGNDLFSLQTVVESLKGQGKNPIGDWSLENNFLRGWHYEFEGFEKGQKFEYIVDAKTGKLIESKLED